MQECSYVQSHSQHSPLPLIECCHPGMEIYDMQMRSLTSQCEQMSGSPPVQRFHANVRERKRMMSINTAFEELRYVYDKYVTIKRFIAL